MLRAVPARPAKIARTEVEWSYGARDSHFIFAEAGDWGNRKHCDKNTRKNSRTQQ